ncbi:MAG: hypothetical protein ACR2P6_03835, partial [Gammaproteobacteria bacterium]
RRKGMAIRSKAIFSSVAFSLLCAFQMVSAQQVTIDFEEFQISANPGYTKGFVFTASGSSTSGVSTSWNPSHYFRAYDSEPACGGGCFAEASSEFHLLGGGPFAFHSVDTHAGVLPNIDVGEFEGQSAVDGSWFNSTDYPDLGQGPWLNVTSVRYSYAEEAVSENAIVQLRLDDVVVEEIQNAAIDFLPWDASNEAQPQDDYFFTVGIETLSIADDDPRDFDATTIDPTTATFGPASAPNVATPLYLDFDNDGDTDIVLGFRMEATGITCLLQENDVKLVAQTISGETIAGIDTIVKTGCDGTERLDFEELAEGTSGSFISKGFLLSGTGSIMGSGNKVFATEECIGDYGGCYFFYASLAVRRADGQSFALYDYDFDAFCSWIGGGCQIRGTTVQGEDIRPSTTPLGTGGWLSLRSVRFSTESYDWSCDGCYLSLDNLHVGDGTAVEIDFDPWNADNEIRPKDNYLITVQIDTTSIADGDAQDFDSANVDPASLRLGPGEAEVAAEVLSADHDGDGDIDYIFGFQMQDTGYTCTDGTIEIYGNTTDGVAFFGTDSVQPIDCEEPMPIDVEPYQAVNRVYPEDDYLVQVAVLTTSVEDDDPYDFSSVDHDSLRFGPAGAEHNDYVETDVDNDGDDDTVYTFWMDETGITCGDTEVTLTGERSVWRGEVPIPLIGTDTIQTEDCQTGNCHP